MIFLVLVDFDKRNVQVLEMKASIYKVKLKHTKVKFSLEHTMKTQTGKEVYIYSFFNLDSRRR